MQAVILAKRYAKVSHSSVIQGGGSSGFLLVHILVMELYYFLGGLAGCSIPRCAAWLLVLIFTLWSTVNITSRIAH